MGGLLLLATAACGSAPPRQVIAIPPIAASAAGMLAPSVPIMAGDVLYVDFPYRTEASRSLLVRNDGYVTVPMGGAMMVAGLTIGEVQTALREYYAEAGYNPLEQEGTQTDYVLGVGDEVEILFRHEPELNAVETVRPDGRISLALVNSVVAEGKRPEELARELIQAYGESLRHPELVVVVRSYRSERTFEAGAAARTGLRDLDGAVVSLESAAPRHVYVAGEVRQPGFVPYQPHLTALQALATVGGTDRRGRLDHVLVLRRLAADSATATYLDLESDVAAASTNDMVLQPFDVVIVPRTGVARVADFMDQYLYQLLPATRNVNFTYFLGGATIN